MGLDAVGKSQDAGYQRPEVATPDEETAAVEPTEAPPKPAEAKPVPKSPLETSRSGQAVDTATAEDLPIAAPKDTNAAAANAAWGAMGATAQSSSGPKAVAGSENVIDTPEEQAHQDLKRTVAEIGIRQALEANGAPKDQLDALTQSVVDKMFTGEGETPGGNIGFALAADKGIVHKDASGKEYYEFGVGGEGSKLDLNGDGQNDSSRHYFKVDKAAVDALSGSTVPFTDDGSAQASKGQAPAVDPKSNIVPSSSELEKMTDAGLKKLQQISEGLVGKGISETAARLAEAYTDSAIAKYGPLLDAAEPSLEAGAQKVQDGIAQLSNAKEQLASLPEKALEAIKDVPGFAKTLSPTLSGLSSIAKFAHELANSKESGTSPIDKLYANDNFTAYLNNYNAKEKNPLESIKALEDQRSLSLNSTNSNNPKLSFYKISGKLFVEQQGNPSAYQFNPETGKPVQDSTFKISKRANAYFASKNS